MDIASHKTKNWLTHIVYLSELSKTLINELKPITGEFPFVFNTTNNERGFIHSDSLNKVIWRLRKSDDDNPKTQPPLAEMKPFTIHDLHRSAATCWGKYLKVSPHVIERMLNHQPINKLVATYQRATYADEKKNAWLA